MPSINLIWTCLSFLSFALIASSLANSPQQVFKGSSLGQSNHFLRQLFSLHKDLVSIPSISGKENDIAIFLRNYLERQNLTVELQPVAAQDPQDKPRFNVFAYPPGHRQTPILLTSHIDTVPPFIPYASRRGDEVWGRGSVDAKGSVATQIFAYLELVKTGQIRTEDASLLFVVGEENSGDGMLTANSLGLKWKAVIFGEPTELKLVSGHKGLMMFTIKATGKEAHSGYPWLGQSAVEMILPALSKLQSLNLPSSEKYGNSTLNIGYVRAGEAANVVAASAEAGCCIRIAAGQPEEIKDTIFNVIRSTDARLEVMFKEAMYAPVDIDADVPGFDVITVNYGTDVPNQKGDNKRYLYGPGSILVSHASQEHLQLQDLEEAVAGYQEIVRHALTW